MRFSKANVAFVHFLKRYAWHTACALSVCVHGEPQLIRIKFFPYIVFVKDAILVKLQDLGN